MEVDFLCKGVSPTFLLFLNYSQQSFVLQNIFPPAPTAAFSHFSPFLLKKKKLHKYIYLKPSHPSRMITQAARMCSDACVCPLDESRHYRLALLQRYGFKGTCLNNLTLLQTSGWWRRAWSPRNHFTPHASKIIIFSCCISYQIFTLYLLQQQNIFTTKFICYGRDKIFPSSLPIFWMCYWCYCSLSIVTHYLCHGNTRPINPTQHHIALVTLSRWV